MTDFAAKVHFRTALDSEARAEGFVGGYGWFFGRFGSWKEFEARLRDHLRELGYDYLECETLLEIENEDDLNEGEQRELYAALSLFPIQYRTIHLYRHDDA